MFKARGAGWADVNTLLYVPLAALAGVAWWRLARHSADVLAWTAPLYLGVYLAWPYAAGTRYLLPLLPLLWLALWELGAPLARRRRLFAILLLGHLGVAVGYLLAVDAPRARACHRDWPAVARVAARVRAADGPLAAVATPECVRLMLSLAIDRPVTTAVAADTAWVLQPESSADATALSEVVAGGYRLARRR
jgi:hypothetical protein